MGVWSTGVVAVHMTSAGDLVRWGREPIERMPGHFDDPADTATQLG